jgi:hypothetical protein
MNKLVIVLLFLVLAVAATTHKSFDVGLIGQPLNPKKNVGWF